MPKRGGNGGGFIDDITGTVSSAVNKVKESAGNLYTSASASSPEVTTPTPPALGGRKIRRKKKTRRSKKGGCFSLKWLTGTKKRKMGRKSRKSRR